MPAPPNQLLYTRLTLLLGLGSLVLVVLALWLGHRWSERQGLLRLAETATERLELYSQALESEVARFAHLPGLAALDEDVAALLGAAVDPLPEALAQRASRKLARLNARAGSQAMYLVRQDGRLLASSNAWRDAPAEDLAWIARIAGDLRKRSRGFFPVGASRTDIPYFMAHLMRAGAGTSGWVIVQISLAPLEGTWADLGARSASEKLMVLDGSDVVVMSSVPGWRHRTLVTTADRGGHEPPAGHRRNAQGPEALDLRLRSSVAPGVRLGELDADQPAAGVYVAQEREMAQLGLRLLALADPADLWRDARLAGWGMAAAAACIGLLALYLLNRSRLWAQLTHTRNELQAARTHLERQVQERTNELLQAGRLAALGQMSAGIAHEVNQPLTALRALSGNTLQLLAAGREREAMANVRSIGEVAERMGRLTAQLKTFARKATNDPVSTSLLAIVTDSLLLLDHRIRDAGVQPQLSIEPGIAVRCDATRLGQVLINLLGNALDAMQGMARPQLHIEARIHGDRVVVSVADNGPGMSAAEQARLFEPFFTTKPAGEGLGLGLMISQKIVSEGGGTLRARSGAQGGMVFEFDLECAWSAADV